MTPPILVIDRLKMHFPGRRSLTDSLRRVPDNPVRAVDGVSFDLAPGEVLALVGESGSGKTTTGNLLLGLLEPTGGQVLLNGEPIAGFSRRELTAARKRVQMIFQDPYESLNPRQRVGDIVAEPLRIHHAASPADIRRRVHAALGLAGLNPPDAYEGRLPFELSGGQRQRVAIAAALILEPQVLVADEPVSMLDVSIRAEILNLIRRLATERSIAVLMITHDLATVFAYADRVAVMYLGRIVEAGPTGQVLADPQHPYTRALLSVLPVADPDARDRASQILVGETPDPSRIPSGCRFHPRCPVAVEACRTTDPALVQVGPAHEAACILVGSGPIEATA
ncbi:MAG TPA: ABC transporter ATP-binding protein [Candidatus Limnocylindria bacterium]|nr:ABC transporter ATP-binding protein [Candidatus Limnocylindria bacterium]